MTFSALVNHPNHLRLPLWVYEDRGWGFGPDMLVKRSDTDWERVAREKTGFCNFVYLHEVPYRDAIFRMLNGYKRVRRGGAMPKQYERLDRSDDAKSCGRQSRILPPL